MSEKPEREYGADTARAAPNTLRRYTLEPAGPFELLVMKLAREFHDEERPGEDWFGLVGSSVTSFCRRACEAGGMDWAWIRAEIERERLDPDTERR